jgi:hypothetical protein
MPKPKMFLGSSGEGSYAARILSDLLSEHVTVIHWARGAEPSETIIEYLERMAHEVQLAALLVTPEDQLASRAKSYDVPRDNVIFELGFFMGALGRANTFIVLEEHDDLKLPSDLDGVIRLTYPKPVAQDYRSALERPSLRIQEAVIRRAARADSTAVYLPELTATFSGAPHITNAIRTTLVRNGSGRYECFALSAHGSISHCYELKPRGNWSVWAAYHNIHDAQDFCTVLFDQRLMVAVLNRQGELAFYRQVNRTGTWGKPRVGALGLRVGSRLLATSPAYALTVSDTNRVLMAPVSPDGADPLHFVEIAGLAPTTAPIRWIDAVTGIDDTAHVIAVDQSGAIWHARQIPDVTPAGWTEWNSVASVRMPIGVQVATSAAGRLLLAVVDGEGGLLVRVLRHPDGTNWIEPRGFESRPRVRAATAAAIAFRAAENTIRLYTVCEKGKLHVFSIDEATLSGAAEVVDVADVQSIICSNNALDCDLLLVGFSNRIEARCA